MQMSGAETALLASCSRSTSTQGYPRNGLVPFEPFTNTDYRYYLGTPCQLEALSKVHVGVLVWQGAEEASDKH